MLPQLDNFAHLFPRYPLEPWLSELSELSDHCRTHTCLSLSDTVGQVFLGRDWSPPSFAGHVRRRGAPSYQADFTFEFRVVMGMRATVGPFCGDSHDHVSGLDSRVSLSRVSCVCLTTSSTGVGKPSAASTRFWLLVVPAKRDLYTAQIRNQVTSALRLPARAVACPRRRRDPTWHKCPW